MRVLLLLGLFSASGAVGQSTIIGSFDVVPLTDPFDETRNTSFLYAWETEPVEVTVMIGCAGGGRYSVGLFHPEDLYGDYLGEGEVTLTFDGRHVLGPWPADLERDPFTMPEIDDVEAPLALIRSSRAVRIVVTQDGETRAEGVAKLRRASVAIAALNCTPEAD